MRHTPPRPIFKSCTSYARIRALRTPSGHSLPVNRGSQHRGGRYIADDDQTRAVRCNPRDTGCLRWRNYFCWISWYKRAPMLALCSELICDAGNFTFIQLWLIWRARRGLFLHRRNLSAGDPALQWSLIAHDAEVIYEWWTQAGFHHRSKKSDGDPFVRFHPNSP